MEETLLIIHILSAAAWIGGSLFLGFAGPRMAAAGGPAAGAWTGVALASVTRFFTPVALLTALSGASMVAVLDEWEWSDGFVSAGLGLFVLALAVAVGNNLPAMKAGAAAAQAGNVEEAARNGRRLMRGGMLIVILLFTAEVTMVLKWGT